MKIVFLDIYCMSVLMYVVCVLQLYTIKYIQLFSPYIEPKC